MAQNFIDPVELEICRLQLIQDGYTEARANTAILGVNTRLSRICRENRADFERDAGGRLGVGPGEYIPQNREDVMYMVCWTLTHTFDGGRDSAGHDRKVYGGIVRDFIVGGRVPNDIDVILSTAEEAMNVGQKRQWTERLVEQLQRDWPAACNAVLPNSTNGRRLFEIVRDHVGVSSIFFQIGSLTTSQFHDRPADGIGPLTIDCNPQNFHGGAGENPGIPCDVDNMAVSRRGLILKKARLVCPGSPFSPLGVSMAHAIQQSFVFYLNALNGGIYQRGTSAERRNRLTSRGWRLLNPYDTHNLRGFNGEYPNFWELARITTNRFGGPDPDGEFTYLGLLERRPPPVCLEIRVRTIAQRYTDLRARAEENLRGIGRGIGRGIVPEDADAARRRRIDEERRQAEDAARQVAEDPLRRRNPGRYVLKNNEQLRRETEERRLAEERERRRRQQEREREEAARAERERREQEERERQQQQQQRQRQVRQQEQQQQWQEWHQQQQQQQQQQNVGDIIEQRAEEEYQRQKWDAFYNVGAAMVAYMFLYIIYHNVGGGKINKRTKKQRNNKKLRNTAKNLKKNKKYNKASSKFKK